VALITGSGSGIGRAAAILLARHGATVVVTDLDGSAAENVASEIGQYGGIATSSPLDVTQEPEWQRVVEAVLSAHQRLDVLVNNAGVSLAKPTDTMTLAEWRRVISVNMDGVFLGTKQAILAMKKGGGGSIVNVASVSGIKPAGGASAYCASKAAVRMFSMTAAIECADAKTGIRVNLVSPGGVKTPMWEKMPFFQDLIAQHGGVQQAFGAMEGKVPSQQFFVPEEVAETILYLTSDESSHLTGIEIVLDRGHTA